MEVTGSTPVRRPLGVSETFIFEHFEVFCGILPSRVVGDSTRRISCGDSKFEAGTR